MQLNTLGLVHTFLRQHVQGGAFCIDATAGKGRDTALLCRLAGLTGRVLAFDIQQEAVDQTRALLAREGLTGGMLEKNAAAPQDAGGAGITLHLYDEEETGGSQVQQTGGNR